MLCVPVYEQVREGGRVRDVDIVRVRVIEWNKDTKKTAREKETRSELSQVRCACHIEMGSSLQVSALFTAFACYPSCSKLCLGIDQYSQGRPRT